ncbi:hypothetical protein GGQ83_003991 [Roseococcus suduntuyensis]|uniref:Uncharacterized protein n=1 Tax=Roseococcus suduntuyensis TaxID=455361 RepID=A0A840AIQ4_9PROT|nr:hypothetical protein [Roseococcus suduntuyensis]
MPGPTQPANPVSIYMSGCAVSAQTGSLPPPASTRIRSLGVSS